MLENRIGSLFLVADTKTSLALFERVYQFLFVENIVLGIVVILIVFTLLISLFKKAFNSSDKDIEYSNSINNEKRMDNDRPFISATKSNSYSSNHSNTTNEMDYSSDLELVAVITAAIMAYLGEDAPEDGLVIRSIRKVNRRNHVNNYSD